MRKWPNWTVLYNIVSAESDTWIGTGREFFDEEYEAQKCLDRLRSQERYTVTLRRFHEVDLPYIGAVHSMDREVHPIHKKILDAAKFYDAFLTPQVKSKQHLNGGKTTEERLEHLRWMCGEIENHIQVGRFEKANRWLGFIQGILFSIGNFSLEDLKRHNTVPD